VIKSGHYHGGITGKMQALVLKNVSRCVDPLSDVLHLIGEDVDADVTGDVIFHHAGINVFLSLY
jgi:hypothetical protein